MIRRTLSAVAVAGLLALVAAPAAAEEVSLQIDLHVVGFEWSPRGEVPIEEVTAHLFDTSDIPWIEIDVEKTRGGVAIVSGNASSADLAIRFSQGDKWLPVQYFEEYGTDDTGMGGDPCSFELSFVGALEPKSSWQVALGVSPHNAACGPPGEAGFVSGRVLNIDANDREHGAAILWRLAPGATSTDDLIYQGSSDFSADGSFAIEGVYADGAYIVEASLGGDEFYQRGNFVSTYSGGEPTPEVLPSPLNLTTTTPFNVAAGDDSAGHDFELARVGAVPTGHIGTVISLISIGVFVAMLLQARRRSRTISA